MEDGYPVSAQASGIQKASLTRGLPCSENFAPCVSGLRWTGSVQDGSRGSRDGLCPAPGVTAVVCTGLLPLDVLRDAHIRNEQD